MSSVKISQLPVASTVSASADALPIVHAGVTQKVTPALLVQSVLPAPGAIGGTTPAAGSFTTLNASGAATLNNLSDVNGNEWIKATATTSAVNEITVANAAVGNPPKISASGDDVDISLYLVAKGTGAVVPDSPFIGRRGIRSLSSTDGVGYFTGAGGTITQTPNRTSTVTIDKICGQIITVSATTTAGLIVEFTVNNSTVAANDTVIANIAGAPTGKYILNITRIVAGSFVVQTYTPAAVLGAEALTINFSVIRSVIS